MASSKPAKINMAALVASGLNGTAKRASSDVSPETPWLRYTPGALREFPMALIDLSNTSFRFRDFGTDANKEAVARLKEDLTAHKIQEDAILLVFRPPHRLAVIVDGWTRVMALKAKGATSVLANFADYKMSDEDLEKRRFRRHGLRRDYTLQEMFLYFEKKKAAGKVWSVRDMAREFGYPVSTCGLISKGLNDPDSRKAILSAGSFSEAVSLAFGDAKSKVSKASKAKNSEPEFRAKRVAGFLPSKAKFKIVIEARGPEDAKRIFKDPKDVAKWVEEQLGRFEEAIEAVNKR